MSKMKSEHTRASVGAIVAGKMRVMSIALVNAARAGLGCATIDAGRFVRPKVFSLYADIKCEMASHASHQK